MNQDSNYWPIKPSGHDNPMRKKNELIQYKEEKKKFKVRRFAPAGQYAVIVVATQENDFQIIQFSIIFIVST
jgi:predicted DNA-binding helix-hairpin-helix protein